MGRHALSASCWLGLGNVLRERDRLLEALRLYRRVLRLRNVARANDLILAHNNLGELYLVLGRLQRSLDERLQAVDGSRSLGNQFLLAAALRGLGSTLWALGRVAEAEETLREAIGVLEGGTDPLHLGSCYYFLGRIEAARGCFRDAMVAYRRALLLSRRKERSYEEASTLALLGELVKKGRRRLAHKLLTARLADGQRERLRWSVQTKALAARAAPAWPEETQPLLAALEEGEERGELWATFLAMSDAIDDPSLPAKLATELGGRRQVLLSRLSRRLSADEVQRLRRYWLASATQEREVELTPTRTAAVASGSDGSREWGASVLDTLRRQDLRPLSSHIEALLSRVLALVGEGLPARGVWTVNDSTDDTPFYRAAGSPDEPTALLAAGGDLLEEARRRSEPLTLPTGLVVGLGADGKRLLYAEAPLEGWSEEATPQVVERFLSGAAVVELLLELAGNDALLTQEQALHRKAREELRQLTTLIIKDKELLDTALITRRMELVEESRKLSDDLSGGLSALEPIAASVAMKEIMSGLPRLANGDLPVLVLGESGVGKDLIARWIHYLSPRRRAPFLAEICSLPESLLEAELFGFVRGAFTDALDDRAGLFQRLAGGTLYLDEVGDLSPGLQTRLIRVLATRKVRPLGSEEEIPLDFRLISSSRLSSLDSLLAGGLRDDLFYRLQGQVIVIPPLRDRLEDIEPLARSFLAGFAQRRREGLPYLPQETLDKFREYSWPGNVRELENELARALVENPREIFPDQVLRDSVLHAPQPSTAQEFSSLRSARNAFERDVLVRALRAHAGNASQAARSLRITRRHVGKLLEKHGIQLDEFKKR